MIQNLFKLTARVDRSLLLALSFSLSIIACLDQSLGLLNNPYSWQVLAVVPSVLLGGVAITIWSGVISFLIGYERRSGGLILSPYLIGGSFLMWFLLISLSYISQNYETLSLSIVTKPDFIYVCNIFLLGIYTVRYAVKQRH